MATFEVSLTTSDINRLCAVLRYTAENKKRRAQALHNGQKFRDDLEASAERDYELRTRLIGAKARSHTTATLVGNPDWTIEPGDSSVGIFGHAIYHESCSLEDVPEATDDVIASERKGDTVYDTHEVTCPCGATVTYTETTYDPINLEEQ